MIFYFLNTSVNDVTRLLESMKAKGWKGPAIDVVDLGNGRVRTLDNTRVLAAHQLRIRCSS
jgi:hypothetical protein